MTTGTGAELVEPFFFMGADAARLVGAEAARWHLMSWMLQFMEGYLRLLLPLGGLLQLSAEHR